MPSIREQIFPLQSYPTGVYTYPSRTMNSSITGIYIEIKRCTTETPTIWPLYETVLKYDQEISFDGGKTWVYGGGFVSNGGILFNNILQTEMPITTIFLQIPPQNGNNKRRIRGAVNIVNGPLLSQGFIEMRY